MSGKRSVAALSVLVLAGLVSACGGGGSASPSTGADGTCTPDRVGGSITMGHLFRTAGS